MKRRWAWYKWFWTYSINSFVSHKPKWWVILHGIIPSIKFMFYMERDYRSQLKDTLYNDNRDY